MCELNKEGLTLITANLLIFLAGTTRLELATSGVTGPPPLPYPQGFKPLTLTRDSLKYILGMAFGVRFGVHNRRVFQAWFPKSGPGGPEKPKEVDAINPPLL